MQIFSASRLCLARQKRGLSKKALAERIGKTPQAVTNYEYGADRPQELVVEMIAGTLDFPIEYFFESDLEEVDAEILSFRARRSMTASVRDKACASAGLASGILSPHFRKRFRMPDTVLPDMRGEDPRVAAAYVRDAWQLGYGPIGNMIHLLEWKGVEVYWIHDPSPSLDAFSFWKGDIPYVFMNMTKTAGDRCRYNAAHELGHLILHKGEKSLDARQVEAEANAFASALLLPEEQFRIECPKQPVLTAFFPLKERWKVSIQAMVRRGRDLQIFSDWQYETACKKIATEGWRINEPGSDRIPVH
jgi:Zn-dependent peptidase ImmA (M78 family)/DNA-binding XRE family transcriptional regulator